MLDSELPQMLPLTSRPYISAYMPNGVTVSGPPHSLAQLRGFAGFKHLKPQIIQIDAPYHASHLYSRDDVDDIVQSSIPHNAHALPNRIPVFSSTGSTVEGGNFETLLRAAVGQILLRPIRWSGILEELQSCVQKLAPRAFSVVPIGTKADQLIYTALKQTSLRDSLLSQPALGKPSLSEDVSHSRYGKSKLAIIGMSGRFPGAKDNEAFWDLLYQGLDGHKPEKTRAQRHLAAGVMNQLYLTRAFSISHHEKRRKSILHSGWF